MDAEETDFKYICIDIDVLNNCSCFFFPSKVWEKSQLKEHRTNTSSTAQGGAGWGNFL